MKSTQGNVDAYRRLSGPSTAPTSGAKTPTTRQTNSAPALNSGEAGKDGDAPETSATSAAVLRTYLPFFINWLGIVSLIFGGCCSNVSWDRRQRFDRFDLTWLRCLHWNRSSSECSTPLLPPFTIAEGGAIRWEPESGTSSCAMACFLSP